MWGFVLGQSFRDLRCCPYGGQPLKRAQADCHGDGTGHRANAAHLILISRWRMGGLCIRLRVHLGTNVLQQVFPTSSTQHSSLRGELSAYEPMKGISFSSHNRGIFPRRVHIWALGTGHRFPVLCSRNVYSSLAFISETRKYILIDTVLR